MLSVALGFRRCLECHIERHDHGSTIFFQVTLDRSDCYEIEPGATDWDASGLF